MCNCKYTPFNPSPNFYMSQNLKVGFDFFYTYRLRAAPISKRSNTLSPTYRTGAEMFELCSSKSGAVWSIHSEE